MSKKDIFNDQYTYLAYPIQENTYLYDELAFSLGVPLKSKLLEAYKYKVASDSEQFSNYLVESSRKKQKYSKLVIVKIPTSYLGYIQNKAEYTPCMPLIKAGFDYVNGERNYLIHNLILGIYDTETTEWKENPNYDVKYNPNGLQFADEQIDKMKIWQIPGLEDYALSRRNIPYKVLKQQDELSGVFNPTIEYYRNIILSSHLTKTHKPEK